VCCVVLLCGWFYYLVVGARSLGPVGGELKNFLAKDFAAKIFIEFFYLS
jgi:hypothetical protein